MSGPDYIGNRDPYGSGSGTGFISGTIATYALLPTPVSTYAGQFWLVTDNSGGFFSALGIYKYPKGIYSPNSSDVWEQVPLSVKVSEDSTTLLNITNWSEFYGYAVDVAIGDRLIYDDIKYKNLTGTQTSTAPDTDITNWEEMPEGMTDNEKRKLDAVQGTGLLNGAEIEDITGVGITTLNWSSGHGLIVDDTNPYEPIVHSVDIDEVIGDTPTTLGVDNSTIVCIDSNDDVVYKLVSEITSLDRKNYIMIGAFTHIGGDIVRILQAPLDIAYGVAGSFSDFVTAVIGPATISGNIYFGNANMTIGVLGGEAFIQASNFRNNTKIPDTPPLPSEAIVTMYHSYNQADPSVSIDFHGTTDTIINPTLWDDGSGTLQTVPSNYYTIQRIFRSREGTTYVAYGQQLFKTKALAVEHLGEEIFVEKSPLPLTLFRCSLILAEKATDLSDTDDAEFHRQASFRLGGVSNASNSITGITTPGGVEHSIQYRDEGVFAGADNFLYDGGGIVIGRLANSGTYVLDLVGDALIEGDLTLDGGSAFAQKLATIAGGFGEYENHIRTSVIMNDWYVQSGSVTISIVTVSGEDLGYRVSIPVNEIEFVGNGIVRLDNTPGMEGDINTDDPYVVSVFARFMSGVDATIEVDMGDGTGHAQTITSEWTRHIFNVTCGDTLTHLDCHFDGAGTSVFQFAGWQVNEDIGDGSVLPYASTNGVNIHADYGAWVNGNLWVSQTMFIANSFSVQGQISLFKEDSETDLWAGGSSGWFKMANLDDTDGNYTSITGHESGGQLTSGITFRNDDHSTNYGSMILGARGSSGMNNTLTLDADGVAIDGDLSYGNVRTFSLTRDVPSTLDDIIEIGNFSVGNGGRVLEIELSSTDASFSRSKTYLLATRWNQTDSSWVNALPITETGHNNDNNYDLDINVSNNVAYLRLRRSGGSTTAATVYINIKHVGSSIDTFTETTATDSVTAPTDYFGGTVLTQVDGVVNIPSGNLEISGDSNNDSRLIIDGQSCSGNNLLEMKASVIGSGSYWIYAKLEGEEDNAFLVRGDGRVTIGAITSSAALHVANGEIWVGQDGVLDGKIQFRDSGSIDSEAAIYTDSLGDLIFQAHATNANIVNWIDSNSAASFQIRAQGQPIDDLYDDDFLLKVDRDGNTKIAGELTTFYYGGYGWYENLIPTSEGTTILNSDHESGMDYMESNKEAPNNSTTAERAFSTAVTVSERWFSLDGLTVDEPFTVSVWAKLHSGDGSFAWNLGNSSSSGTFVATSEWKQFTASGTCGSGYDQIWMYKMEAQGSIDFDFWQINSGLDSLLPYCKTLGNITELNYGSWTNGYSGEFQLFSDGTNDWAHGVSGGKYVISDQPLGVSTAKHYVTVDDSGNVALGKNTSATTPELATVTININSSNGGSDTYPDGLWVHNDSDGDAVINLSAGTDGRWAIYANQSDGNTFKIYNETLDAVVLTIGEDGSVDFPEGKVSINSIQYFKTAADLPGYGTGTITLVAGTRYIGPGVTAPSAIAIYTDTLVFDDRATLEHVNLNIATGITSTSGYGFTILKSAITYLGAGTLFSNFTLGGVSRIESTTIIMYNQATAKLFDLKNQDPNGIIVFNEVVVAGTAGYDVGSLVGLTMLLRDMRIWYFTSGLTIHSPLGVDILSLQTIGVNYPGCIHITTNGNVAGGIGFKGFQPTIQSNEYALYLMQGPIYSSIGIGDCVPIGVTDNFFYDVVLDSGSVSAFSSYVTTGDSMIEVINSPLNTGIAALRFDNGSTLGVGIRFTITSCDVPSYEGTWITTGIYDDGGTIYHEVHDMPYVSDIVACLYDFDCSIASVGSGHTFNIDTLNDIRIVTNGATTYDYTGYAVYASSTLIVINHTYDGAGTGTWTEAGKNQKDVYVKAVGNTRVPESKIRAFANRDLNAYSTIINNSNSDTTYLPLNFGIGTGLVAHSSMERWRLMDEEAGTFMYTGFEPFSGDMELFMVLLESGVDEDSYRFKESIDGVSPIFDSTDAGYISVTLREIDVQIKVVLPLDNITTGQVVQVEAIGVGTGDVFTITNAQFKIT